MITRHLVAIAFFDNKILDEDSIGTMRSLFVHVVSYIAIKVGQQTAMKHIPPNFAHCFESAQ